MGIFRQSPSSVGCADSFPRGEAKWGDGEDGFRDCCERDCFFPHQSAPLTASPEGKPRGSYHEFIY